MDLEREEQVREVEALRQLQNFLRTPTWKRVETDLREQRDLLEQRLGDPGFTDADRAMLHGRLAMLVDCLFHLPRRAVEREIADRSPSIEADDPLASLHDPTQRPELV